MCIRDRYAEVFDELDMALEGLGGNVASLDALETLEAAISRGKTAFMRKEPLDRLKAEIETLSSAVDVDAFADKFEELNDAMQNINDAVDGSGVVTAPKSFKRLSAAIKQLKQTATKTAKTFKPAYEKTNAAFETISNKKAEELTDEDITNLGVALSLIHI